MNEFSDRIKKKNYTPTKNFWAKALMMRYGSYFLFFTFTYIK